MMDDQSLVWLVQENLIQAGMYVRSNRILGERLLSLLEPVLHGGVTMCGRVKNSIRLTANPGCFDWADNTITNLCCVLGDLLKGVSIGSPRPIYLTKNEAEYVQTIIRGAMEPIPEPKENDDQTLLGISKRLGEIKECATIESDEDFFAIGFAEGFIYGFARQQDFTDAERDQQTRQAKGGVDG